MTTLRSALSEPVQEPVTRLFGTLPVYDTPPQRKPLTTETIYGLFVRSGLDAYRQKDFVVQTEYDRRVEAFARAVERAHGITP